MRAEQRVDVALRPVEVAARARPPSPRRGAAPGPRRSRKTRASSRVWASVRTLWKSGTWQTSHSRRTDSGLARQRHRSRGRARAPRARAGRRRGACAAARAAAAGGRGSRAGRAARRSPARRCARRAASSGAKRWDSTASHQPPVEAGPARPSPRTARRARGARRARRSGRPRPAVSARGPTPVELAEAGEGHGVDVEVQSHADRVGRDQVVDVAGLVQPHLGVARARRERAEDERRAAALAAQARGQLVELAQREHDHRRAPRQLREPLGLGVAQRREPRPRLERGVGQQLVQQRPDRLGPDQPGLERAAGVEDAVGEDVPALAVGGELHLVDRQELDLAGRAASPRPCRSSSDGRRGMMRSSPVTSATASAPRSAATRS